jgi:hypothetical protein
MTIFKHHFRFILREIGYALIFTACITALSGGVVILYAVLNAGLKWHDIIQLIMGLL